MYDRLVGKLCVEMHDLFLLEEEAKGSLRRQDVIASYNVSPVSTIRQKVTPPLPCSSSFYLVVPHSCSTTFLVRPSEEEAYIQ
jgi:hypothetical protein